MLGTSKAHHLTIGRSHHGLSPKDVTQNRNHTRSHHPATRLVTHPRHDSHTNTYALQFSACG